MEKIPNNARVCLFSDSPDRLPLIAKELQVLGILLKYMRTFRVFASCSAGSICSNSTFCWWAAYFAWQQAAGEYMAYFPNRWVFTMNVQLFTLPFTQSVNIDEIPAFPTLNSFSHY
jgi:hypothetical protein